MRSQEEKEEKDKTWFWKQERGFVGAVTLRKLV